MFQQTAAEIISLGGKVMFAKGQTSSFGVTNGSTKNSRTTLNYITICFN